ncbi:hypothetical protein M2341_000060 [Sphingobium sp. B7D2B]|nr:hypothetical protein [Sphingobium sp. B7D2B]MCW2364613.1 hypothetical protein [Sphingobium sp. B7D2B]
MAATSPGDEPATRIVFENRAFEAPSVEEARLIVSWLEAELLDLFKDTS